MKLKKTFGLLFALTISASALLGTNISFSAQAEDPVTPPAAEEASALEFDQTNAKLHLPDSYEEFLPLENPAYVAMNEEHIAIADNYYIYIYDRAKGEYDVYHHLVGDILEEVSVSKVQFTDKGKLYFRDDAANLYEYDFDTKESLIVNNLPCLTFLIHGDYLYMANASPTSGSVNFSYVPVDDVRQGAVQPLPDGKEFESKSPLMAYEDNTLYCIINNNTVNAYDGATHKYLYTTQLDKSCPKISDLKFVCAYGDEFFYTVKGTGNENNGLWRTDHSGNAKLIDKGDDYSTLTAYGGKLYCIQGKCIREMDVTEDSVELTGYEISSSSSSPHRLSNAGETARTKELAVYADKGNHRVSVYNIDENTYTPIYCLNGDEPFEPEHIAINKEKKRVEWNGNERIDVTENLIAVSNGDKIYEYTLSRRHSSITGKTTTTPSSPSVHNALVGVRGLTYVYGECYYITETNGYGSLSGNLSSELHFNGHSSPDAIASDIYGTIYVAFGNQLCKFTEDDFKASGASGEILEISPLSESADKIYASITVDYEGNVWHLTFDGKLYCNNEEVAKIDGNDFVFLNENHDYPVSFALSFEDDEIYFNFRNYVVKTNEFALESLPSLNKITAGEAKTKAFDLADLDNLFVKVPEGSVGFEIALDKLKTGEGKYFPYESYFRSTGTEEGEARRGVLLYEPQEEDGYYVVALYNGEQHAFTANLFKKSKNSLETAEKHLEEPQDDKEKNAVMYITSDVSLCSAPCLYPAPAGERLSPLSDTLLKRGTQLKVLGYAEGEDRVYAFVEVVNNAREAQKGFIPRSYLTKNDPLGIPDQNYKLGYLKGDAGVILKSADGEELAITEKTEVKLYENEDGTYTAVVEKDGVIYSNTVTPDQISRGETDALRVSLIVILSVLALVIIGGYAFLMFPRKKKK